MLQVQLNVLGFGLLFLSNLYATSSGATTLYEAIQQAGATNPYLQAAINQQLAGAEKADQGLAGLLPVIELSGSYSEQNQPGAGYATETISHSNALTLNQPLFDVVKFADYLRGKAQANSAAIALLKAQQTLIYDVAEAYGKVLYQRQVLKAAHAAALVYGDTLHKTSMEMSLGDATRVDVDEAQANLDLYQAKEIDALNQLKLAGEKYIRLTGLDDQQISSLDIRCLLRPAPPRDETALFQRVLAGNVEIRAAQAQWEEAKVGVIAATVAHLPTVNLQASYGTNWSRSESGNDVDQYLGSTYKSRDSRISINVSVPIFSGGGQLSRSREAAYSREQARYSLLDTQQKAKEDLRNAMLSIQNSYLLVGSTQRVVQSEKNKVNSTIIGKQQGQRTQLDELNARQNYYDAVNKNAEAVYNLYISRLALYKVMGTLGYSAIEELSCSH